MKPYLHTQLSFIEFTGPDAERYLNGQISQNVSALDGKNALWFSTLNHKGGIQGIGTIRKLSAERYLVDCPTEIVEELSARLDKYLIADDCEWRICESKEYALYTDFQNSITKDVQRFQSNRFRTETTELLLKEQVEEVETCSIEEVEQYRIQHGVPAWGTEITEGSLTAESGLTNLAVSFGKGCYTGQEVVSRLKTSGKTRRNLFHLQSEQGFKVGDAVLDADHKEIGTITSGVGNDYLALCKTKHATPLQQMDSTTSY